MVHPSVSDEELIKTLREYEKCGNSATKAAIRLGIDRTTVGRRLRLARERKLVKGSEKNLFKRTRRIKAKQQKKTVVSLDDFRSQFDSYTRTREAIQRGLEQLEENSVVRDTDFRQEFCGLAPANGWRQVAEEEQFRKYQFLCGGKIWWGTPNTVKKAINMVSKAKELI